MNKAWRAVLWAVALVAITSSLAIAAFDRGGPRTAEGRVRALTEQVACPTCEGQSVAQSDAPAAANVRRVVSQLVDAGQSDAEILGFLADESRFGEQILLKPASRGISTVVWAAPVIALVVALAALASLFRRWSSAKPLATDEDRELVAAYLSRGEP